MPARLQSVAGAVLLIGAFASLIAARRPEALIVPQFWAEDGMEWYARAHNKGALWSLVRPYGGYLQTFPRLVGIVSVALGLRRAPLVMAAFALFVQALVPAFLVSSRFEPVVPGRLRRLVLALVLVTAPNLYEVHLNVTNSHVHLAMLAFLVLIAPPSAARGWRAFDLGVLLLSGFSGPFCLLLLPVAALVWMRERTRWNAVRLACVAAPAVVQARLLYGAHGNSRMGWEPNLGASFESLLEILGGQVFVGGLVGLGAYTRLHDAAWGGLAWLPAVLGALGLAFVARAALVTRSFALRALLLFAAIHLAAALRSPVILGPEPSWELLQRPLAGMRYYYFSILAFLATLLWTVAADRSRVLRVVACGLLAVLLAVGIPSDFALPPQPDLGFPRQVARFEAAPLRERVVLEITPPPWTMTIVKRRRVFRWW